jgi:hypothetical protein
VIVPRAGQHMQRAGGMLRCLLLAAAALRTTASAPRTAMVTNAEQHPARAQIGRWAAQPSLPPLPSFADGPIAGNGDLGLTWGGPPERVSQYICKKDFWTGAFFGHNLQRRWGMLLASTIVWEMPSLKGSQYNATMEIWNAETNFTFGQFHSNTFIGQAHTPRDVNFFVTEFGVAAGGGGDYGSSHSSSDLGSLQQEQQSIPLTLRVQPGNPAVSSTYNAGRSWGGVEAVQAGGWAWAARNNTNNTGLAVNPYIPGPGVPQDTFADTKLTAAWAVRVSSADGGPEPAVQHTADADGNHTLSLTLLPGRRYALVYSVATRECGGAAQQQHQQQGGNDANDAVMEALRLARMVATQQQRNMARSAARAWWAAQWATTPVVRHFSPEAEEFYYGVLYAMAASKRAGKYTHRFRCVTGLHVSTVYCFEHPKKATLPQTTTTFAPTACAWVSLTVWH